MRNEKFSKIFRIYCSFLSEWYDSCIYIKVEKEVHSNEPLEAHREVSIQDA